ncbi:MAG: hypothetical protein HY716_16320 [Planctomycetes bacterium]|nr:hypothetical protein [Planctomycetota bacterium]
MHAATDIRIVKCLDGLHYSFEILDYAYADLYTTCVKIKEDPSAIVPALWRCWTIVDTIHRIREIAQATPGLSKKAPELVAFLKGTDLAKDYRHYIQHLRKELSKNPVDPFPVWGSLSWVDPTVPLGCLNVLSGAQVGKTHYTSCVYDKIKGDWVSKVCLGAVGMSFDFDLLYGFCVEFRKFIMPWIMNTYAPGIRVTTKPAIISAKFVTREECEKLGIPIPTVPSTPEAQPAGSGSTGLPPSPDSPSP